VPDKACAASERRACRPGWDRLPVTPAPWPPRWRPHYATHPRATMPTDPGPKEPPTSSRLRSSSRASPDHGQDPPHAQVERASPAPETTPLSPHDHPSDLSCRSRRALASSQSFAPARRPLGRSDPAPAADPARVSRRPVRPRKAAWRCSSHKQQKRIKTGQPDPAQQRRSAALAASQAASPLARWRQAFYRERQSDGALSGANSGPACAPLPLSPGTALTPLVPLPHDYHPHLPSPPSSASCGRGGSHPHPLAPSPAHRGRGGLGVRGTKAGEGLGRGGLQKSGRG